MQIAASTRCYAEMSLADCTGKLTDHGFGKVELCLNEQYPSMTSSEIAASPTAALARYSETTRLTPVALDLENDVTSDEFREIVTFARLMKLTQVSVMSSPLGTPFNTEIDRLRDLVATASQDGVRVSMKTHLGRLTEDPHTAVELCQSVKGLGITLDPSHYICNPRGVVDFDVVFPHVYHCHLRDTLADQLQVQTGLGQVDYSRVIGQLKQNNFSGALSVDLLAGADAEFEYPLEMRKLRRLLESLL